jgi:predicted nucleic acid-binding protein
VEGERAATSTLTIAELKEKYLREEWRSFEQDLEFVTARTFVAPVDRQIALLAGELNHERKKAVKGWGMADSVVLATARTVSAKVVTGDRHFEGLPDAIIV